MSTDNVVELEQKVRWVYAGRRWTGKDIQHAYVDPGDWTSERRYTKRLGTGEKPGRDVLGAYYTGKVRGSSAVIPWDYDGLIERELPDGKLM